MSWRIIFAAVLVAVIVQRCFGEMWIRWYPSWGDESLTLWGRLSEGGSYYSHGPLVMLCSLGLSVVIYNRVGFIAKRSLSSNIVGWVSLLIFSGLYLLGLASEINFVAASSLVGVVFSLAVAVGGWLMLRAYWQAIGMLLFMIPLPLVWISQINYELKIAASDIAIWLVCIFTNVKATGQGSYVLLHGSSLMNSGGEYLVIEEVCSGLRSLITLTWFSAMLAVVCQLRGGWRWAMLLVALPVAFGCNVLRIAAVIAIAGWSSVETIAAKGQLHQLVGMMTFAGALAMMLGFEQVVLTVGQWRGKCWGDGRLLGRLDDMLDGGDGVVRSGCLAGYRRVVVYLLVMAGFSCWLVFAKAEVSSVGGEIKLPGSVLVDGNEFYGREFTAGSNGDKVLGSAGVVRKKYVESASGRVVDVLSVHDWADGGGIHPPEICVKGVGATILWQGKRSIEVGGESVVVREMMTGGNGQRRYHVFAYHVGDKWTSSINEVQVRRLIEKVMQGSGVSRMVRVSALVDDNEQQVIERVASVAGSVF